jgi:hypothetical protein
LRCGWLAAGKVAALVAKVSISSPRFSHSSCVGDGIPSAFGTRGIVEVLSTVKSPSAADRNW